MKDRLLQTLTAATKFFLNKFIGISVLVVLMWIYSGLPTETPLPFAEHLYLLILIFGASVVAPFIRLLIFPEAAEYAESGGLRTDLKMGTRTPALLHYWWSSSVCFVLTIVCFATVSH